MEFDDDYLDQVAIYFFCGGNSSNAGGDDGMYELVRRNGWYLRSIVYVITTKQLRRKYYK